MKYAELPLATYISRPFVDPEPELVSVIKNLPPEEDYIPHENPSYVNSEFV